ncbi:uncharacterized protein LOC121244226 [Juglans microcarpa x Juglans regia]|uniref:uncharacterized protein LOC121244226 n=1 Tax=Juglans microcarpa x Juglans regia TaxID=2249226 RepID=UPI001B7E0BE4|nr:uncharacterized protein LOC121244226 [Juglans microcarpa x Juglans regia]
MDVWGERDSPLNKWSSNYQDFRLLWLDLLSRLDVVQLDQVTAILHKIWARRNCFVFNNKFNSPLALVRSALNDIEVYHELHLSLSTDADRLPRHIADMGWRPPSDPYYKLNFDVVSYSEKRLMGIGIVVRNSRGEVLIVASAPRSHICSAFSRECYALLRSIKLCQEMCLHQAVFEGDAKALLESVNGYNNNYSWQG